MDHIRTDKLILTENDLNRYRVWDDYASLRAQLYKAEERKDCVLIQGAAFVVKGKAFLLMGVGGIDFLDSLAQLQEVDGIIGNGNSLFLSRDFRFAHSAHSPEELGDCYELERANSRMRFLESAEIGPLIFLLRSFRDFIEYSATKEKVGKILFEVCNTYARPPMRFAGSMKSRLRSKFLATARVVHCARRPSLLRRECLFDSFDVVREAIDKYEGEFALVYTLWSQELCEAVGMKATRQLRRTYNPCDPITPYFVKIAKDVLREQYRGNLGTGRPPVSSGLSV